MLISAADLHGLNRLQNLATIKLKGDYATHDPFITPHNTWGELEWSPEDNAGLGWVMDDCGDDKPE